MNELKVETLSLKSGNMETVSASLGGGSMNQQSVNLNGGDIDDSVGIMLEGGSIDAQPKNIRGEPLRFGTTNLAFKAGKDGKSAYDYAKENGYLGTEEEFGKLLADLGDKSNFIVDSLDSEATDKALSANQGRVLNEKVESNRYWFNIN